MVSNSFIINRITFRTQDNIIYKRYKDIPVIFFINRDIHYSPHQYHLILKSIYLHSKSFQNELLCFFGSGQEFIDVLKTDCGFSKETKCVIDETDNPVDWNSFDNNLKRHFNVVETYSTLTIINWKNTENHKMIEKLFTTTYFPQLKSFKKLIDKVFLEVKNKFDMKHDVPNNCSVERKNPKWLNYELLKVLIVNFENDMIEKNLIPFKFPDIKSTEVNFDDQVKEYFKTSLSSLRSSSWHKPYTNAGASLHTNDLNDNQTSKCSFLFALGILSPMYAYIKWGGGKPSDSKIGSATDQILWREFFHACSNIKRFWPEIYNVKKSFWQENKKWIQTDPKELINWKTGNTSKYDTNIAMIQLKKEGWLHHLQRHVVADYLTRGFLNYDWRLGESWFKETLIDHDAAINRANWLWLSASAFSSKQKFLHYNHDNYISKHTKRKKSNKTFKKTKGSHKYRTKHKNKNTPFPYQRD